ncbi:MAG: carboxypeptidase regulatory-like domain-containing protein [Patescibacteria group bacterium]
MLSSKIGTQNQKAHAEKSRGFTLVESLVSLAVFSLLLIAVTTTALALVRQSRNFRENTTLSGLADQYLEIARNLPYSQIGTENGNPHGNLPDFASPTNATINGTSYQIYYVVTYIDDPADGTILAGTDISPNDYKQLKLYIKNTLTNVTTSFLSTLSPKGLEGLTGGGALSIKVFDAVGQPVPNATITITNTSLVPDINLTRTSDAQGNWAEVGLPASANSYHVVVTKNGYSTDQTYPISVGNPSPTKPDGTILAGQATQISFSIDLLSDLVFNTLNQTCTAIPNVGLGVRGAKLIGTPSVYKFNNSYTSNGSGQISLPNLEWDSYTPALIGNTYMIYGSSPIQQINILPDTSQTYTLVLGPKTDNSLLVIVKDSSTGNPLQGASVNLTDPSVFDVTEMTSGSVWSQEEWSDGSGQVNFVNPSKYFQDDGNVNTLGIPSGLRLADYGGVSYAMAGSLESSTFDTGTTETQYTNLLWQPTSQDPATTVKFQIATNSDNATWNYVGPDGTNGTYFTVPGTTIHSSNNNMRYLRYKTFLSTTDNSKTPVLTSISVNYVSGCFTPGQAMFPDLENTNYQVRVSLSDYQTQIINPVNVSGYGTLEILLSH